MKEANVMKKDISKKNDNLKIKLSKGQQLRMLEFFVKTSIPRMLKLDEDKK